MTTFIISDPYHQPIALAEATSIDDVSAFCEWQRSRAEANTTERWVARAGGEARVIFAEAAPLDAGDNAQWQRAFGMSKAAAVEAVRAGHSDLPLIQVPPRDSTAAVPNDHLAEAYQRAYGLTEAVASVAAHGTATPAATPLPSACSAPSKSCAYRSAGLTSPQLHPPKPLMACTLASQDCPYDTPKA
jgi:hypothetical protein